MSTTTCAKLISPWLKLLHISHPPILTSKKRHVSHGHQAHRANLSVVGCLRLPQAIHNQKGSSEFLAAQNCAQLLNLPSTELLSTPSIARSICGPENALDHKPHKEAKPSMTPNRSWQFGITSIWPGPCLLPQSQGTNNAYIIFAQACTRPTQGLHFAMCLSVRCLKDKLHQHRPQTATNHISTTFVCNKELIGHPVPEKRKPKKSRETSPGTLAKTRRTQDIMMEHNPFPNTRKERKVGRNPPEGTRKWRWNRMPQE